MNSSKNDRCKACGRVSALTLGVLLASRVVCAQASDPVSEKDFLAEMPMVLSVSRLSQRLDETPGAVTLIDRELIRRSGARDVADLLRLVPGFQVSNAFESVAPLVSYHGAFDSYSNRLELLIDGRSAYSPYFIGSIGPGLQTVALEDIERIEVLRGSNSAAYGARAILGVINIVTRHTADTLGGQGTLVVGENGVRDVQARIGWGDTGGTFRLTASRRADDGLDGANGANQVRRVNLREDITPAPGDELQVRLGVLSIDAGKGFAGLVDNPPRPSVFDSAYAQIDYRRSLSADEDVAFRLSHSQESYTDEFPYSLQRFKFNDVYMVRGTGQASSDVLTLQHTLRHSDSTRLVWGGEFRSERIQSSALYNTDSPWVTDFTRLFGNLEWRIAANWQLNAGAMAEHSSVTGDTVSPRLMANWQVAPGQTLRLGVSNAFRPPSTFEKFGNLRYVWNGHLFGINTLASGQVQAETVQSKELGYLGEFPGVGLSVDMRLFHEQINGFIRQQNNVSPKDYINDENFAIQGLEYQLKWRPWQGGQVMFNQTYTDIGSKVYGVGTAYAAPRLASTLAYFQKLPHDLDLTLMHQDNGTATLTGGGLGDRMAMTRTDLRLAKAMRWGTRRGEVALVIQNLGLSYADFSPLFQFRRQAFVTLRLED
ncbi:TonB-dependent receptor [Rhodoferax sp.]|uniref:TonB-dependent receptor plug domain-containing protein n=1 Tax=Rhodoferax sp. TaxID=50421 RepID=UPI00260DD96C|nr:TonB-dependent receptor [Rhodoferax sp.]MDD2926161.1 TonB-dependent receptor [Rhodoferax sp.]